METRDSDFHGIFILLLLSSVLSCVLTDLKSETDPSPKGIHLSLGKDPSEMVLVWGSHFNISNQVQLPVNGDNHKRVFRAEHILDKYIAGEPHYWNKAVVTDLGPSRFYKYDVKNGNMETGYIKNKYKFKTWQAKVSDARKWSPTFLLQNNLHLKAPLTLALLSGSVKEGEYHGVFDIGANLCGSTLYHMMWNASDLAAYVPYFPTPGMDGLEDKFYEYKRCFAMTGGTWPMTDLWYSFDVPGFAHVISFSTEVPLFGDKGKELDRMLTWMKKDLDKANSARNRQNQPWIIALANRPIYCSNVGCAEAAEDLRKTFEDVLYNGGVDLVIQSLEGSVYSRTWPVYRQAITDYNYLHPYAPVYLNSGAFRCRADYRSKGKLEHVTEDHLWFAKRVDLSTIPTYGVLKMVNRTQLTYEEWMVTLDAPVMVDQFNITQYHHGPFGPKVSHQVETVAILVPLFVVLAAILALIVLRKKIQKLIKKRNENSRQVQYAQMEANQVAVHA